MKFINRDYCKGCQICVEVCPKTVYDEGAEFSDMGYLIPLVARYDDCIDHNRIKKGLKPACELCILSCPDQAIHDDLYGDDNG
ncbi:MAG: ferredoxin family protein [Thermoplasmata archaeon]|nr:ferredoxin family protein [Thermoplasmata archaeon]